MTMMTIRIKAVVILGVTVACLLGIAHAASSRIILTKVLEIEKGACSEDVERVSQWLSTELAELEKTATDWSAWDEMYAFAQDTSDQFITVNLYPDAIATIKINFMLVAGADGSTKFARAWDRQTGEMAPPAKGLEQYLTTDRGLLTSTSEECKSGLVILDDGPALVAARPILPSDRNGNRRGTLIVGRKLDPARVEALSKAVRLSVKARPYRSPADADIPESAVPIGKGGLHQVFRDVDERVTRGLLVLDDVRGNPGVVLEVAIERLIYQQGRQSLRYFNYALLAAAAICMGVMLLLLERTVLSRLSRLSADVAKIGESDDLSLRLELPGRDEVARLARDVNTMLSRLDESRRTLEDNKERLERSRDSYLGILDDFPNPIWRAGTEGGCDYFNKAWLAYTGRTLEQELGNGWEEGIHPADLERYHEVFTGAFNEREPFGTEYRLRRADGEYGWLLAHGRPITDPDGAFAGYVGSCYDVTERKRMEGALVTQSRALAKQVRRNELIIHTAMEGYLNVGLDGKIREINRAFCDIVGYAREELLGMDLAILEAKGKPDEITEHMKEAMKTGHSRFETKYRRKDGAVVDMEISTHVVRDGNDTFFVVFARDISERIKMSKELARLAQTDQLTGIGNRRSFVEAMTSLAERRMLCRNGFAFIMSDVDGFKAYNDTYGHLKGDEVLTKVVSVMASSLRAGDRLFRYGGEEFIILLPGASPDNARAVADRICAAVRALAIPHSASRTGIVTVSCGVSACAGSLPECPGWEEILRRADGAMYKAKAAGRDRVETLLLSA